MKHNPVHLVKILGLVSQKLEQTKNNGVETQHGNCALHNPIRTHGYEVASILIMHDSVLAHD